MAEHLSQTPTTSKPKKGQHLSVDFEKNLAVPRDRASSISAQTVVEENPEFEARKAAIKRRGTHVAVVKLSWWDCIKAALFGTKNLKRQLAATVEWAELEDTPEEFFDGRDNPYMLIVSAYKRNSSEYISARCVLDTGCVQGNIISADLAHRLGFTDIDFQPLTPREEEGGMVATGEVHKVMGTIRVSWFSSTSPKVFNTMRFLVSETANVDLVIGTRSITKERLLLPPNLMADSQFLVMDKPEDPDKDRFVTELATAETAVVKAEVALENTKEGTKERAAAEKALKKAKSAKKTAERRKELHAVNASLDKNPEGKTLKALLDTKKGLEAKLAGKQKKEQKEK